MKATYDPKTQMLYVQIRELPEGEVAVSRENNYLPDTVIDTAQFGRDTLTVGYEFFNMELMFDELHNLGGELAAQQAITRILRRDIKIQREGYVAALNRVARERDALKGAFGEGMP